jgi:hypothetical protein
VETAAPHPENTTPTQSRDETGLETRADGFAIDDSDWPGDKPLVDTADNPFPRQPLFFPPPWELADNFQESISRILTHCHKNKVSEQEFMAMAALEGERLGVTATLKKAEAAWNLGVSEVLKNEISRYTIEQGTSVEVFISRVREVLGGADVSELATSYWFAQRPWLHPSRIPISIPVSVRAVAGRPSTLYRPVRTGLRTLKESAVQKKSRDKQTKPVFSWLPVGLRRVAPTKPVAPVKLLFPALYLRQRIPSS